MSLQTSPPEICFKIFSYACLDSGYTGRSLSLVSRYINEASKPFKFQSIAIHGHHQLVAFASLLKKSDSILAALSSLLWKSETTKYHIRYLFISSSTRLIPKNNAIQIDTQMQGDDSATGDSITPDPLAQQAALFRLMATGKKIPSQNHEKLGKEMAGAVHTILKYASDSIEILDAHLSSHTTIHMESNEQIEFPRLKELSTDSAFPLSVGFRRTPQFSPCLQLRCLRLRDIQLPELFVKMSDLAPNVTHIRFDGLQEDDVFPRKLGVALGILESVVDHRRPPVAKLPHSVRAIHLAPDSPPPSGWCGTARASYSSMMMQLGQLHEMDDRFVLLKATAEHAISSVSLEEDWIDRVNGKQGCWAKVDTVPRTGRKMDLNGPLARMLGW